MINYIYHSFNDPKIKFVLNVIQKSRNNLAEYTNFYFPLIPNINTLNRQMELNKIIIETIKTCK